MKWEERKSHYNEYFFTVQQTYVKDNVLIRCDDHWRASAMLIKEICNPMRVLDCGCATGGIVYGLQTMEPPIDTYGFDFAAYAIAHAVPEVKERLLLLDAAVERLPFSDGSFDLIVAFDFFEHQDDEHLPSVMAEICRVSGDKILIRQPMVHFAFSSEDRDQFIKSLNNLTHRERIALIDNHEKITTSQPDPNCPYHPQERGRDFWISLFESYGYKEITLGEKYYKYPNVLHLTSFTTLLFQKS